MEGLGYDRYVAQGGDLGAAVTATVTSRGGWRGRPARRGLSPTFRCLRLADRPSGISASPIMPTPDRWSDSPNTSRLAGELGVAGATITVTVTGPPGQGLARDDKEAARMHFRNDFEDC
jgi:hypothetical protein